MSGTKTAPSHCDAQYRTAVSKRFLSAAATRSPGRDAARGQAAGRRAHLREQLGVGRAPLAVDERERLGMALGAGQEVLAEVHASVPATSAIASTIGS